MPTYSTRACRVTITRRWPATASKTPPRRWNGTPSGARPAKTGSMELKLGFGMERMPCGQLQANAVFFRLGVRLQLVSGLQALGLEEGMVAPPGAHDTLAPLSDRGQSGAPRRAGVFQSPGQCCRTLCKYSDAVMAAGERGRDIARATHRTEIPAM